MNTQWQHGTPNPYNPINKELKITSSINQYLVRWIPVSFSRQRCP